MTRAVCDDQRGCGGTERFTSAQLRAYDPTPQELFDHLRAHVGDAGQSPDGEVFVQIADATVRP